ncbi:MAG: DUF2846 domain-containing protein [Candidatus Acidiferrales bacterium]
MKTLFAVLLFASSAFAQNQAPASNPQAAACGPNDVHFNIKQDSSEHPALLEPGKALVYVIQDEDNPDCFKCDTTTRVGLDGAWVGTNNEDSYFYFSVEPGEHHLCANRLSQLGVTAKPISLLGFTAEVGKTYYFRIHAVYGADRGASYSDFGAVNPDEAKYLISISPYAVSRPKK